MTIGLISFVSLLIYAQKEIMPSRIVLSGPTIPQITAKDKNAKTTTEPSSIAIITVSTNASEWAV